MRRWKRVIAVVPMAGLALAGCSGSSSSKSSTPTTHGPSLAGASLEQAAYVMEANQVCKEALDKVKGLSTPGDPANDPAQVQAWDQYLQQVVSLNGAAVASIKSLVPPPGDEAKVKQINEAADAQQKKLEAAQQAAASGDASKLRAALDALDERPAGAADADTYGLTECAR